VTNYQNGYKFELQVREYLRSKGMQVVRAAGSRGAIDLCAWTEFEGCVVQCKKERRKQRYDVDVAALKAVVVPLGWSRQLWVKRLNRMVVVMDVDSGSDYVISIGDMKVKC
jgi:Holliday junction resolvase